MYNNDRRISLKSCWTNPLLKCDQIRLKEEAILWEHMFLTPNPPLPATPTTTTTDRLLSCELLAFPAPVLLVMGVYYGYTIAEIRSLSMLQSERWTALNVHLARELRRLSTLMLYAVTAENDDDDEEEKNGAAADPPPIYTLTSGLHLKWLGRIATQQAAKPVPTIICPPPELYYQLPWCLFSSPYEELLWAFLLKQQAWGEYEFEIPSSSLPHTLYAIKKRSYELDLLSIVVDKTPTIPPPANNATGQPLTKVEVHTLFDESRIGLHSHFDLLKGRLLKAGYSDAEIQNVRLIRDQGKSVFHTLRRGFRRSVTITIRNENIEYAEACQIHLNRLKQRFPKRWEWGKRLGRPKNTKKPVVASTTTTNDADADSDYKTLPFKKRKLEKTPSLSENNGGSCRV